MKTIIGLTGGIASGKSTVSRYLKYKGYCVLDADHVVHELQKKGGTLYQTLVASFGRGILLENGELNRQKLSAMIFENPEKSKQSADLQDSIIRQALEKVKAQALQSESIVFMDIPLLFEKGYDDWFDEIWLVYVDEDKQVERLMARNNLSETAARLRLSHQWPLKEKCSLSHAVIDNRGDVLTTYAQVEQLIKRLDKGTI